MLAFACCSSQIPAWPQTSADALVGLWAAEETLGPEIRGELVLELRGKQWHAIIAGNEVLIQPHGDELQFTLPDNKGEFRGRQRPDRSMQGHWIQPAGLFSNNRYASPVHFEAAGKNRWRGQVRPLDEHFSVFVSVERAPDGSITAVLRNPESNQFRRRIYQVKLDDGRVELVSKVETLKGAYDSKKDQLSLALLEGAPDISLSRRSPQDAIGFYASARPVAPYIYHPPTGVNDGWSTASLSEVGLQEGTIAALIRKIKEADPHDNPINIQSLLIARHGKLVLEEYFYGFDRARPHDMRSAGKTLAPVLLGIARDHGADVNPSSPLYSFFPQYKPFANWDERKGQVTVRDVMTMTAGLACDDNNEDSPGNEDVMQGQTKQPDWYKYTLDLPMAGSPGGSHAIYCSADLNLVGGVVRQATGRWLPEFFEMNFAGPLQMDRYYLNLMPTEEAYTGGGAYLLPRDQLKLGQLYLNGGLWNGRRVVSKEWTIESTARHSTFAPNLKDEPQHDYGYGWHERNFIKVGDRVFRDYLAGGNGGQLIIVIPDLDMVVSINGGSYGDFRWYRWELDLLPQFIIPAATSH
jgi:CubicO group peptidase (beta-lactamase class C family)